MPRRSTMPRAAEAPELCLLPDDIDPREVALYQLLRRLHCDRKAASHDCHGRVSLDRNGITLQCPLCGDCRRVYPKELVHG